MVGTQASYQHPSQSQDLPPKTKKPRENQKNQKNQRFGENIPGNLSLRGLVFLFFFLVFSRFFWFCFFFKPKVWREYPTQKLKTKKPRENQKKQKNQRFGENIPGNLSLSGLVFLFFLVFLVFSRFFWFLGLYSKFRRFFFSMEAWHDTDISEKSFEIYCLAAGRLRVTAVDLRTLYVGISRRC